MDAAATTIGTVGLGNEVSQGFIAGIGEGMAGIGCRSVVQFDRRVLFAFGAPRQIWVRIPPIGRKWLTKNATFLSTPNGSFSGLAT
jgi:hypothetical protein